MTLTALLLCAFSLASLSYGWPEPSNSHNSSDVLSTCHRIAAAISGASQVFFPRERVIHSLVILQSDVLSSCTRVLVRHFTCRFFEYRGVCLLGGARLCRGRGQDRKVT